MNGRANVQRSKMSNRLRLGRGGIGKTATLEACERQSGRVSAEVRASGTGWGAVGFAHGGVQVGSTIHAEESGVCSRVGGLLYRHEPTNHGLGDYVRSDATTNGIENVFALHKRGPHSLHHHASPKHLDRYVGEFAFRLGDSDVKNQTFTSLDRLFSAAIGQRLTYEELIALKDRNGLYYMTEARLAALAKQRPALARS